MKFILLVEGDTESKVLPQFLKKWLDPKLSQPVNIEAVRFGGWSELVKDAADRTRKHLNGPRKHEIIAVISLLDLYGLTFPYPKSVTTYQERYAWAKDHMENHIVKQPKFFQFFAVHELEAWLLSDPALFPPEIRQALDKVKSPEAVNFDEPPAKLLHRLYRHKYKKVTHGKELFGKLRPDIAYHKCQHLKAMLDKMLELAQAASQAN